MTHGLIGDDEIRVGVMNCLAETGLGSVIPLIVLAVILAAAGVGLFLFRRGRKGSGSATLALIPLVLGAMMLTSTPAPAQAATTSASCTAAATVTTATATPSATPAPTPTPTATPTPTPTPTPPVVTPPPTCEPLPTIASFTNQPSDEEWIQADYDPTSLYDIRIQYSAAQQALHTQLLADFAELHADHDENIDNALTNEVITVSDDNGHSAVVSPGFSDHFDSLPGIGVQSTQIYAAVGEGFSQNLTITDLVTVVYDDGCGTPITVTALTTGPLAVPQIG